jgi:hypothetical protein
MARSRPSFTYSQLVNQLIVVAAELSLKGIPQRMLRRANEQMARGEHPGRLTPDGFPSADAFGVADERIARGEYPLIRSRIR